MHLTRFYFTQPKHFPNAEQYRTMSYLMIDLNGSAIFYCSFFDRGGGKGKLINRFADTAASRFRCPTAPLRAVQRGLEIVPTYPAFPAVSRKKDYHHESIRILFFRCLFFFTMRPTGTLLTHTAKPSICSLQSRQPCGFSCVLSRFATLQCPSPDPSYHEKLPLAVAFYVRTRTRRVHP